MADSPGGGGTASGFERDRATATFCISPKGLEQQQKPQQQQEQQQQESGSRSAGFLQREAAGLRLAVEDFSFQGQLPLSQSIGEELRPRLQRRNQFIFSRKTALSMDHCPLAPTWSQAPSPTPLQAATTMAIHSHSGSDTGLLLVDSPVNRIANRIAQSMESIQKRRSVTDSTHLRVLHDSLTSLTNRITGNAGSQENLPDQPHVSTSGTASPTSSAQPQISHAKSSSSGGRSRRKMKDSRDKLADCLRACEHISGMPKTDSSMQLECLNLDLEPSWDRVVAPENATTAKAVKQQAAIWELLQTEVNILRHLKTVIEVYMTVLKHLQSSANLLTDVSSDQLFPGILPVFQAHRALWTEHLQPALAAARQSQLALQPSAFYRGFTSFRVIFAPSAQYCMRIAEAKDYLKSLDKNDAFSDFVRWAQRVSQRNYTPEDGAVDLQLGSLLTMPLQCVMKYGLLLQEILRHTDDGEERLALESMVGHVTAFCNELNSTYRAKCDQADLRGVADRIEDAKLQEWVESLGDDAAAFLESYRLNLMRPMPHNGLPRRKIADGDVKFKDDKGKWTDAKCLLFTDLLLLAKSSKRSSLRLLRPPLRLDRTVVHKLSDQSYAFLLVALTDFNSIDCLLCLAGDSQKATDEWTDRITQARASLIAQLQPAQQQHNQKQPQLHVPHQTSSLLQPQTSVDAIRLRNHHQQVQQQQRSATVAITTNLAASGAGSSQLQLHYTRSSGDMDSLLTTTTTSVSQQQQQQQQQQRYITHTSSSYTDVNYANANNYSAHSLQRAVQQTTDATAPVASTAAAAAAVTEAISSSGDSRRSSHV